MQAVLQMLVPDEKSYFGVIGIICAETFGTTIVSGSGINTGDEFLQSEVPGIDIEHIGTVILTNIYDGCGLTAGQGGVEAVDKGAEGFVAEVPLK